jgi:ABC-2 type transport system ATP-binding protein
MRRSKVQPILKVEGVSKLYRNHRGVREISFRIAKGDIFGLFGPNGSGKSTILKIIAGLCAADQGTVSLFGYRIADHFEKAMARVGCMIETTNSYAYMSAHTNLKLAARFYPDLAKSRIEETLEQVGLTPYRHEKVGGFSLGMKQRLALAGVLLSKPEFVILDEPTNGLDIEGMADVRNLIVNLAQNEGITFLISSHMIHDMEQICNQMAILNQGNLIQCGVVADLLNGQTLEQYYLAEIQSAKEGDIHV